ncbi:MAG: class II aldolase/adducin family protein [Minwuia sp.]|nr:class II aldolase/adducin family protein [Minwuia sp.]
MKQLSPDESAGIPFSDAERESRQHLAMAYRMIQRSGLDDLTYNHLSVRVPDRPDHFLIKRDDQLFEQVTASSLLSSGFHATDPASPEGRVSPGGLVIHGGILDARPDVNAVFHTHSPANMAVSAQKCGLLPLCQHAFIFHDCIAYHDFHGFEFEPQMRQLLVRDLGDADVMMLRNHGVLVTGRTVAEAFFRHHYLEMACRAQVAALSIGGVDGLVWPDEAVRAHAAGQMAARGIVDADGRDWTALTQLARDVCPDYAA